MTAVATGSFQKRAGFPAVGLILIALPALAACKDTRLPDLTVPVGERTTLGTDLRAEDPVLGITITDPLQRLP